MRGVSRREDTPTGTARKNIAEKQCPGHAAVALFVRLALFEGLALFAVRAWAGAAGGSAAGHGPQLLHLLPDGRQRLLGVGGIGGGLLHGAEARAGSV